MQWYLKSTVSWLFTQLFVQAQIKKPPKLHFTSLYEGNPLVDSPHKGPVTQKMFPYDDIIMYGLFWPSIDHLHRNWDLMYHSSCRLNVLFCGTRLCHSNGDCYWVNPSPITLVCLLTIWMGRHRIWCISMDALEVFNYRIPFYMRIQYIDGSKREICNSSLLAMELCLSHTTYRWVSVRKM